MPQLENKDILGIILRSTIGVIGRRTSEAYANIIISNALKELEEKYVGLEDKVGVLELGGILEQIKNLDKRFKKHTTDVLDLKRLFAKYLVVFEYERVVEQITQHIPKNKRKSEHTEYILDLMTQIGTTTEKINNSKKKVF